MNVRTKSFEQQIAFENLFNKDYDLPWKFW
jgi:hypothetical protein